MSAQLPLRTSPRRPLPARPASAGRPAPATRSALAGRTALAGAAAALALTLAACGSPAGKAADGDGHSGHSHASATPAASGGAHAGHGMPGTAPATTPGAPAVGAGLASEQNGYRLSPASDTLPAGAPAEYRFTITGPDGGPVTAFAVEQTKRLHFYAIRADLTGFQHLHPEMAADGGWTAPLAALAPGSWRVYASFTPDSGPGKGTGLVLSSPVTVPGTAGTAPAGTATGTATASVDGYTVTVDDAPTAGAAAELKVTVRKDGAPVTDLEPYLESYAHLTAFHVGDQAFAHLHPETRAEGAGGGPTLPFHAELPAAGDWQLFLQFQTAGTLHTAAVTLRVAG
ncbi:hypothetical protein GCM10018781_05220 [Kitasatospora indigofera]|uniref:Secreted protein n=1 Tax=Kitasatospora indigofera TaxID=67307 RepID=A0A919FBS7_9ACTN|nr:hypothetical protein GCM10018781_05220 [Kitasatospora indigofera]